MIEIDVAIDPATLAINRRRWKRGRLGGYVPRETRESQDAIKTATLQALRKQADRLDGDCGSRADRYAVVVAYGFRGHAADADGPVKATLDALESGFLAAGWTFNDRQIYDLHVRKSVVGRRGTPGVRISVVRLPTEGVTCP